MRNRLSTRLCFLTGFVSLVHLSSAFVLVGVLRTRFSLLDTSVRSKLSQVLISMSAVQTADPYAPPHHRPTGELPPIILSNVPGTWAYDTMSRRVRDTIIKKIYQENDMNDPSLADAKKNLDELVHELESPEKSLIRPIKNDGGPDVDEWNTSIMKPYIGMNWLDAPWLYTEFYVYRRVVECFRYFETGFDPFKSQKIKGVTSALGSIDALALRLLNSVEELKKNDLSEKDVELGLEIYISTALWGNRMDLSLWPAEDGEHKRSSADVFQEVVASGAKNLLADDMEQVVKRLLAARSTGGRRVDIVVDNAGFELFCDMCLADYLVASGVTNNMVIQLKGHPTFVSDALSKDLLWMIKYLANLDADKYKSAKQIGERWQKLVDDGKWILKDDLFWVQPRPFWEMPQRLRDELKDSCMIFVKGDANYRRLLGDRLWELDAPFVEVASYWPAPVTALRTLKAELGCGMSPERTSYAKEQSADWSVNGEFAVIQMFDPTKKD